MKFFSKETSQKLLMIGCVTNSMMIWVTYPSFQDCLEYQRAAGPYPEYVKPAFSISDFLGNETYCIENCKIIFGNDWAKYDCVYDGFRNFYEAMRHEILDAKDQEKFIVEAIKDRS